MLSGDDVPRNAALLVAEHAYHACVTPARATHACHARVIMTRLVSGVRVLENEGGMKAPGVVVGPVGQPCHARVMP